MKVKFRVTIGNNSTNVIIDDFYSEDGVILESDDYNGGNHNYNGRKGLAVDRAVSKIYGKNCFWFGEYNCLNRGQVFEALKPNKYNSNPGNSSRTSIICIDIEQL